MFTFCPDHTFYILYIIFISRIYISQIGKFDNVTITASGKGLAMLEVRHFSLLLVNALFNSIGTFQTFNNSRVERLKDWHKKKKMLVTRIHLTFFTFFFSSIGWRPVGQLSCHCGHCACLCVSL